MPDSDELAAAERRGRELAALDIEAESRAYEQQFGAQGMGGHAAAVLMLAAQIAREGRQESEGDI